MGIAFNNTMAFGAGNDECQKGYPHTHMLGREGISSYSSAPELRNGVAGIHFQLSYLHLYIVILLGSKHNHGH